MAPRPSVTRFVRTIVGVELARDGGSLDSDAAQRIVRQFHHKLVKLIGPAGFDMLLARSIVLARREHPSLAGVVAGREGTLAGLDAAHGGSALQEGPVAIVCNFMELLVALISEDLAMRLVADAWPTAEDAKQ